MSLYVFFTDEEQVASCRDTWRRLERLLTRNASVGLETIKGVRRSLEEASAAAGPWNPDLLADYVRRSAKFEKRETERPDRDATARVARRAFSRRYTCPRVPWRDSAPAARMPAIITRDYYSSSLRTVGRPTRTILNLCKYWQDGASNHRA